MGTFKQIQYHIVFGTKYREKTISESHCTELYRYIWGIIKNKKCHLYRINGVEDHLHIFTDLHPSVALADFIKEIKVSSHDWMRKSGNFPDFRGWQNGYGAFTSSIKARNTIINYVKNQKIHHRKENFYDEYKTLLVENGIEFDERYLFQ